ncbi:MAG: hypothetical protein EOS13_25650 [Mesorhizobium sp.]|nr:MAG: hypothetical protein EOS13_25650 [Mesorhizobium sp.]
MTLPPRKLSKSLHCTTGVLRERERARRIPVLKLGSLYFSWWSNQPRPLNDQPDDDPNRSQAAP